MTIAAGEQERDGRAEQAAEESLSGSCQPQTSTAMLHFFMWPIFSNFRMAAAFRAMCALHIRGVTPEPFGLRATVLERNGADGWRLIAG